MKRTNDETTIETPNAPIRTWVPKLGARVQLRSWSDYVTRGINIWSRFRVTNIDGSMVSLQFAEGTQLADDLKVPLESIETPIGWHDRYTIEVKPADVEKVLGWFARGITVRQSHYMPACPTSFQPADNDANEDWRFNGADSETIPASECDRVFRVVKIESEDLVGIPAPCKYCIGGKRTRENNPVLVEDKDQTHCKFCGAVSGFSFDEPYHSPGYRYGFADDSQCANVRPAAECWVCNGTGLGKTYLSELNKKERNRAIAAMHQDGWKVSFIRRGGVGWVRERETVVKGWHQKAEDVLAGIVAAKGGK